MNEKEKVPSERGAQLLSHIHILRGLISYHERMVMPIIGWAHINCNKLPCPAAKFENDVYLEALKEALRLLEREAKIAGSDKVFTSAD